MVERFIFRKEDKNFVVYDNKASEIFYVNNIGKFILELFSKSNSERKIVKELAKRYDAPEKIFKEDVKRVLNYIK